MFFVHVLRAWSVLFLCHRRGDTFEPKQNFFSRWLSQRCTVLGLRENLLWPLSILGILQDSDCRGLSAEKGLARPTSVRMQFQYSVSGRSGFNFQLLGSRAKLWTDGRCRD